MGFATKVSISSCSFLIAKVYVFITGSVSFVTVTIISFVAADSLFTDSH